jgi:hypothetical protein
MARWAGAAPAYEAANTFRQRSLVNGESFLWPPQKVWTVANVARLRDATAHAGEGGFLATWRNQLANDSPDIHRIAVDVLSFYWLCPRQIRANTKLEWVREVVSWKLQSDPPDYSILDTAFAHGFANSGRLYLNRQDAQIIFYLAFAIEILSGRGDPRDPENSQRLADTIAAKIKNSGPAVACRTPYPSVSSES